MAEANNGCRALLEHCISLGAKVVGDARVSSLIRSGTTSGEVVGVKTSDGRSFTAKTSLWQLALGLRISSLP